MRETKTRRKMGENANAEPVTLVALPGETILVPGHDAAHGYLYRVQCLLTIYAKEGEGPEIVLETETTARCGARRA